MNSYGLTIGSSKEGLVSIATLKEKGINYLSLNMVTTAKDHEVSSIIDLEKIING